MDLASSNTRRILATRVVENASVGSRATPSSDRQIEVSGSAIRRIARLAVFHCIVQEAIGHLLEGRRIPEDVVHKVGRHRTVRVRCRIDEDLGERVGSTLLDGAREMLGRGGIAVFGPSLLPVGQRFCTDVVLEHLVDLESGNPSGSYSSAQGAEECLRPGGGLRAP